MRSVKSLDLTPWLLLAAVPAGASHYSVEARVQPAEHRLEVRAVLEVEAPPEGLPSLRVFLHRELRVESVRVNAAPATFVVGERPPDAPRFSPTAVPVDLAVDPPVPGGQTARVELVYGGPISGTVNGVNLVSERLTELALYSAWYPLLSGDEAFTYDVSVTLPAAQRCLTDGDLVERRLDGDTVRYRFQRQRPGTDIALVASDSFRVQRLDAAGFQVEVYHVGLPDDAAANLADVALRGYRHMLQRLGEPSAPGRLLVVASPREGWGYSRVPLSVVSEAYALEALGRADGRFELMHGNLHEVGHFWWQLASTETSDDWINESLAEFTALHACQALFGPGPLEAVFERYRKDVGELSDPRPIVETQRTDPNGYVLYYEKGALLWEALLGELGDEGLFGVLRSLHREHRGTRALTTEALVRAFSRATDGRTDAFFDRWLRSSVMPSADLRQDD
jgi:hypothetical protein